MEKQVISKEHYLVIDGLEHSTHLKKAVTGYLILEDRHEVILLIPNPVYHDSNNQHEPQWILNEMGEEGFAELQDLGYTIDIRKELHGYIRWEKDKTTERYMVLTEDEVKHIEDRRIKQKEARMKMKFFKVVSQCIDHMMNYDDPANMDLEVFTEKIHKRNDLASDYEPELLLSHIKNVMGVLEQDFNLNIRR